MTRMIWMFVSMVCTVGGAALADGSSSFIPGANTPPQTGEVTQKFQDAFESCQQQLQSAQQTAQQADPNDPGALMQALNTFNQDFNQCIAEMSMVSYLMSSQVSA